MKDRFNYECSCCTRCIPCRSTQQFSQRSTTYHSSSSNFFQFLCRDEISYRHTFVSSETSQRNHRSITVTTDNHTFYFVSVATDSLRQEIFETRAIQSTTHTDYTVFRQAQSLQCQISHCIHRVRNNNDDSVRRIFQQVFCYRLNDTSVHTDQFFTSHTRFTRNT